MRYRCPVCGEIHTDLLDVAFDWPLYAHQIPEAERDRRVTLTSDTCIIDGEDFFIRGVIEIPVHDYPPGFAFGVWVSQKEENFRRYLDHFDTAEIGPYFGWLSNEIACYDESTIKLKTMAHFRGRGLRPAIVLEPTHHPLAVDQREGISLERAWEIAHYYFDAAGLLPDRR
jgi:hypothetical protein